MGPRSLALLGCLCILIAQRPALAFPTQEPETLVVAKNDEEPTTVSAVDLPVEKTSKPEDAPTTEGPLPPVKLKSMDVRSEVSMRYAHTTVVTKVRNPAKRSQETNFRVLLPETAFISSFTMTIDGKSYKAYVKEKEEAKKIYNDAVSQGIGAAHVATKARDSNQFVVLVNIESNMTVEFNLTYEEALERHEVYNHAINLHPGVVVPYLKVTVHIKESQKITTLRVPEVRTGNEVDATEDDPQNSKAVVVRCHDDREATITFTPDLAEQRRLMEVYAEKSKQSQAAASRRYYGEPEPPKPEGVLGQFVVQYDVDRPKDGEILVNDGYFVHFLAPNNLKPLRKHVVFVLDTSGSMMDRKIVQLREAMQTILSELNPGDYFSIVEFASSVKVYDLKEADEPKKPVSYGYYSWDEQPATLVPPAPATPQNIARAKTIVSRLEANGGTNIASALNVAVDLIQKGVDWVPKPAPAPALPALPEPVPSTPEENAPKPEENDPKPEENDPKPTENAPAPSTDATTIANTEVAKPEDVKKEDVKRLEPMIIFLTDGDPTVGETDPTRIINRLSEKNYGENKSAIFALAFGEDADRTFLRKLALRNDGFMRHIYEAADAALQLQDFYRQVASPLLADVHFVYPKDQIQEGSLTRTKFRTYYGGSETIVAGRIAADATELTPHVYGVCGVDDSFLRKKYEIFPRVPVARSKGEYLPLERLWAYLTVKQLLDEKDAADDTTEKDKDNSPEKKALRIALQYEFVTPLTSLVVVKPNDTKAIDAESVDKQDSPYFGSPAGIPLAAGGPSAPQFAYKAALSSAIGPVHSAGFASILPSAAMFDSSVAYEEASPQEDLESLDYTAQEGKATMQNSMPMAPGRLSFFSPLSFPSANSGGYSASAYSGGGHKHSAQLFKSGAFGHQDIYQRSGLFKKISMGGQQVKDGQPGAPGMPAYPSTPRLPQQPTLPPQASPSPLAVWHLEDYPWVGAALKPNADALQLDVEKDGNKTVTELELTRDVAAPREAAGDAACARATDGAAGVCVYLSRCDAAKTITLPQYKDTFCAVNNKFAGVCCPSASVDVAKP